MRGKNIAVIFEKTSTRTRVAFEVAAYDQGAHVTYLGPSGTQIGEKESMKDTARVLGRISTGSSTAVSARRSSSSWLTMPACRVERPDDEFHPTQILADFLTMSEFSDKPLHDISYCSSATRRFNMGDSLLIGGSKMGMDVRHLRPEGPVAAEGPAQAVQGDRQGDGRQDHHHR